MTIDALAPGGREGPGSTDGWFRTRPRDPMVSLPTLQREAADRMDALPSSLWVPCGFNVRSPSRPPTFGG